MLLDQFHAIPPLLVEKSRLSCPFHVLRDCVAEREGTAKNARTAVVAMTRHVTQALDNRCWELPLCGDFC